MVKAIIFDCFGVLITDALQALCVELLADNPEAREEIHSIASLSNKGMLDSEESRARTAELLGLSLVEYGERITMGEMKNTVLLDYISELRKAYKIGVLSNVNPGGFDRRFSADEQRRYFDTVVASGEVGYAKPEPQIYELTADRLGVRFDECVFTDDREEYVEAARGVGMQALLYKDFMQFKTELETILTL